MEKSYWQRGNVRTGRRRLLSGAAAGGLALGATAVLGCGDDDDAGVATPAASQSAGQPKRGGTLTVLNALAIANNDIHQNTSSLVTAWGPGTAYSRLVMMDPKGLANNEMTALGDLAERWEQPDEGTLVFSLRRGAKFFNIAPVSGREVVAQDVVYSFERQRALRLNAGFLDPMERWEAPDPYTLRAKLARPDADQLLSIADHHNRVVAREAVEAKGDLKEEPIIGSGPFMLKEHIRSSVWTWVRNPDYYFKDRPYVDTLQNLYFSDRTVALSALRLHKVNSTGPSGIFLLSLDEARQLRRELPELTVTQTKGWQGHNLFAHYQKPPTNDPRVRQALSKILDRAAIIATAMGGTGWLSTTAKLPSEAALLPEEEMRRSLARNLAEARQLLDAAGVSNWRPRLAVGAAQSAGVGSSVEEIVQAQLKDAGINATIEPIQNAIEVIRVRGEFELALSGVNATSTTNQDLASRFRTGGGFNGPRMSDPELDRLIGAQASEVKDRNRRFDLLKQVQRRIIEAAGVIPIASQFRIGAHWPELKDWAPALGPDYVDDSVLQFGWIQ